MQGLRLVNGNQPMQNFPIGIAKFIIENSLQYKLNNQEEFNIIDPCLGWGGRTVGTLALSSTKRFENKIINFYGTDVHEAIYDRYGMLVEFWNNYICPLPNFHFFKPLEPTPYEDILQDKLFKDKAGTFDLALTSPPYFAIEQYSEDQNQSFKKFNTYNSWKEGFLKPLIFNTYILLKSGGEFYLNISDVKSNVSNSVLNELPLINDSIILAKQIGFRFDGKYFMEMPTHANFSIDISKNKKVRLRDEQRHKYEPILVFVK
jgi:hypothetical protein